MKQIKKSYEMVKYNNDLNYMPMPEFTGRQIDLFFAILSQIRDENENKHFLKKFFLPKKRQLVIPYKNFVEICRIDDWKRSFIEIYKEIEDFLKKVLDYKIEYETKRSKYFFVCFEEAEHDKINQTINITFQSRFYDMVIDHKYGFTIFELQEFIHIKGKYAKTLYRLLKQFKATGKLVMNWKEFKSIMEIPDTFTSSDIDKRVLKPALKELQESYEKIKDNGEKETCTPFKNLKHEKLKQLKGKDKDGNEKHGRDIIAIEFTFNNKKDDKLKIELNGDDKKAIDILKYHENQFQRFFTRESKENFILLNRYYQTYKNSTLIISNKKTKEKSKVELVGITFNVEQTINGLEITKYNMHLKNLKTGYIQKNQVVYNAEQFKNYILAFKIDDDIS